jgi:hypothetical protein
MKQTILSNVKDGGKFKIKKYSPVTYTRNKKVRGKNGIVIVITSDSSDRSFEKKGRTKVWITVKPAK